MTLWKEIIEPARKTWQFLLIHLLFAVMFNFIFWNDVYSNLGYFFIGVGWSMSISLTQWLGAAFINNRLSKVFPWIEHPIKRMISSLVLMVSYSVSAFGLVQWCLVSLINDYDYTWDIFLQSVPLAVIITAVVSLLFSAMGFFSSWKKSEVRAAELKSEMLAYKYETLRNQINPHFLFNSFNVLTELVYDDKELAVKFIRELSDLYRYVIESRNKELVPLEEELQFMDNYLFLLSIRFEDKLKAERKLEGAKGHVVPMALQLLYENAVKHNEVSMANPLSITLTIEGEYLVVQNNLQKIDVGTASNGTGLQNLKQRYAYFTDAEVLIEETATHFTVKVPLLKNVEA